jgi:hypothetical protein
MISIQLFAYILFLHYLGDYIFQPYSMSVRKSEDHMMLLYHTIIYTSTIYLGLLFVVELQQAITFSVLTFLAHYIVDIHILASPLLEQTGLLRTHHFQSKSVGPQIKRK